MRIQLPGQREIHLSTSQCPCPTQPLGTHLNCLPKSSVYSFMLILYQDDFTWTKHQDLLAECSC